MLTWIIVAAAAAGIAWVNWYFFWAPKGQGTARAAADGAQEVNITVEGGYSPTVVRVKKGAPVRLVFDRREKSPCSEELVISKLGIKRFLKPLEKTAIEIEPREAGTYEFACGMNMLRGRIEVEG